MIFFVALWLVVYIAWLWGFNLALRLMVRYKHVEGVLRFLKSRRNKKTLFGRFTFLAIQQTQRFWYVLAIGWVVPVVYGMPDWFLLSLFGIYVYTLVHGAYCVFIVFPTRSCRIPQAGWMMYLCEFKRMMAEVLPKPRPLRLFEDL